jgi:hypothetical protein
MVAIVVLLSAVALLVGLGDDAESASRPAQAAGTPVETGCAIAAFVPTGPSPFQLLEPEITEVIGLA